MEAQNLLKSSILTEKASMIHAAENKYTFEVARTASKGQIKEAVEKLYKVTVIEVNVLRSREKTKRSWVGSRKKYARPSVKKAIVQLKKGDKLNLYDGGDK
jgi:large subunit ribosomal protein L23